ncbi:MAG: FAD-binding protein [Chloroflexi bacterium]|nr:MAG: FAD-binding protein [Chloroflexota bacterium]
MNQILHYHRRKFLKLCLLVSASTALGACRLAQTTTPKTILILGAGIAGLAAGHELTARGHTVILIEGRNRIGGRIHTHHDLGVPVDMGASWIHGVRGNPITDLRDEFDIETRPTDYDDVILFSAAGEQLTERQIGEYEAAFNDLLAEIEAIAAETEQDISVATAIEQVLSGESLDAEEQRILDYLLFAAIESDYAARVSDLSIFAFEDRGFPGNDHLFPGGYSQIVDRLAEGLDIRLSQVVHQVKYAADGITVFTEGETYQGDFVIVTLPLGVLKSGKVTFSPSLPASKQAAIQRLEMGLLDKTVLKFPRAFWPEQTEFFGFMSNPIGENSLFMNLLPVVGEPILLGFSAADAARQMEQRSDEEIVAHALEVLRGAFGVNIPEPVGMVQSRWAADPFTLGSYSYTPVGARRADRVILGESVAKKLFFAGEATHPDYPATVHGAYLSGIRAAREVTELVS